MKHQQHMSDKDLIEQRRDYSSNSLSASQLNNSPVQQFENWLADAREAKLIDATAMVLSTTGADSQPRSRVVLLKAFDEAGFCWYTDQQSQKGQDLQENPLACLLFYWRELERQVRIEGSVQKLSGGEADHYFNSRPEGSRFSAASSHQSQAVDNRAQLEAQVKALHEQHPDGNVPRPDRWGGYQLKPTRFEFWQGRDDRLHDRFIYTASNNDWHTQRLSP